MLSCYNPDPKDLSTLPRHFIWEKTERKENYTYCVSWSPALSALCDTEWIFILYYIFYIAGHRMHDKSYSATDGSYANHVKKGWKTWGCDRSWPTRQWYSDTIHDCTLEFLGNTSNTVLAIPRWTISIIIQGREIAQSSEEEVTGSRLDFLAIVLSCAK